MAAELPEDPTLIMARLMRIDAKLDRVLELLDEDEDGTRTMKRKRPKRTPEEIAADRELKRMLELRVQRGMQEWENRRAAAEGREPREIPIGWPSGEELDRMYRERLAQLQSEPS